MFIATSYMSFRDMILCSQDILTFKEVYDALVLKEKMKHLVGFEAHGEGLIVYGDYESGISKSNFSSKFCNYCKKEEKKKKKRQIEKDCYNLSFIRKSN